jgi:hypothetical protein
VGFEVKCGAIRPVVGSFFLEAAGEDFVVSRAVDGVGGDLEFEHAVGQVFADAMFGDANATGGSFERFEFAAAFVDADGSGLGVDGGFGFSVFVLASDLAYPQSKARWRTMSTTSSATTQGAAPSTVKRLPESQVTWAGGWRRFGTIPSGWAPVRPRRWGVIDSPGSSATLTRCRGDLVRLMADDASLAG